MGEVGGVELAFDLHGSGKPLTFQGLVRVCHESFQLVQQWSVGEICD